MVDNRIAQLERRARETGSEEDLVAWDQARIRAGEAEPCRADVVYRDHHFACRRAGVTQVWWQNEQIVDQPRHDAFRISCSVQKQAMVCERHTIRVMLNYLGYKAGVTYCIRCGDYWNWKPKYAIPLTPVVGVFFLCQPCGEQARDDQVMGAAREHYELFGSELTVNQIANQLDRIKIWLRNGRPAHVNECRYCRGSGSIDDGGMVGLLPCPDCKGLGQLYR